LPRHLFSKKVETQFCVSTFLAKSQLR
jgi:hypothetical protein